MKILITLLSFFWIISLFSAEKITFEKYKELIRENYPNLYNYRPGRVFLTSINVVSDYTPEGSDKVYVCKYTGLRKETIIRSSVLMDNNYYLLTEFWIEPLWDISTEEGKVCERGNFGPKKGEEEKSVFVSGMELPPFIRPYTDPFLGVDTDPPELHDFSLNNDGLVVEEWSSYFGNNNKYVYDLKRPMPFIKKFGYQNDKLNFEKEELPEVNRDELILTLDKVPVYMGLLRPNGLTRTLKISDDFKKFWQDDIEKGPFALPVTTVEGL